MVFPNYSSSPFIPGFEMGNMMAFVSPETLVANNANRKKLIEQRSKKNNEVKVDKPSSNTSSSPLEKIYSTSVDTEGSKYSPSLFDRIIGGFKMGGQAYGNIFRGRPLMTGIDQTLEDLDKGIVRDKEGDIIYQGGEDGKIVKVEKEDDEKNYLEENKELLGEIADLGEEARQKDFLRENLRKIANAPEVRRQYALANADIVKQLSIANMGAMAAQNRVLAENPAKLPRIAGKYFTL